MYADDIINVEEVKMTLGEKLAKARKENNITQEELADTLGVTRQSISKWESDLAYPETDKLIKMSNLFGCSLDYLLKEKATTQATSFNQDITEKRAVSVEDAKRFLTAQRRTTVPMAIATVLCILSPLCLMLLAGFADVEKYGISMELACGVGLSVMLLMVASAVGIFIFSGKYGKDFAFLQTDEIIVSRELATFVQAQKQAFYNKYLAANLCGSVLCILSMVPLFMGIWLFKNEPLMILVMVCIMLVLVAIAVFAFVSVGIRWAGYHKLLQTGQFTPEQKRKSKLMQTVTSIYWLVITALFLLISFTTKRWDLTWLLWAVAGVLYPALVAVLNIKR